MRMRPPAFLLMIAASLALAGCLGKVKYPTYYALELPPAAEVQTSPASPASIAVREFRSPEYLRRGSIVYRPSAEEVGFYNYSRWATEPPKNNTEAVVDHLRASGNFSRVKLYDGRSDVDYVMTGELEQLDEVDYGGGVRVEVALSAQITDSRTGKTIWQNSAAETANVNRRDVPSVASDMSQAMDRSIIKLLGSVPVFAGDSK